MLICYLDLSRTEDFSLFKCPGVGTFKVFSGTGKFRNKIECSYRKDSTIPPGSYWIVDRPTGGIGSKLLASAKSLYSGNDRSKWFALFRVDEKIDDETLFQGVHRNLFRIHPAGDGGISNGCITFKNSSEFAVFRNTLLQLKKKTLAGTNIQAYGVVVVTGYSQSKTCNEE